MAQSSIRIGINVVAAALGAAVAGTGCVMSYLWSGAGSWIYAAHLVLGVFVFLGARLGAAYSVLRPLAELRQTIDAMQMDGDLSRRAKVTAGGEAGKTADAFNRLIQSFQGIIGKVIFNSRQVARGATQVMQETQRLAGSSEQQRQAAQATAQAMAEMSAGITDVADNAEQTALNAQAARETSRDGEQIAVRASEEIERIAHSVEESARVIAALGERSQAISGIVKVIHDIADQTNLLALNAAIEAARAGEQGRGFAVVADEVRKLAERTSMATREISAMIGAVQQETQSAIESIQQGSKQAHSGAELARDAASALARINHGALETMAKVDAIAAAIAQHGSSSRAISGHLQDILSMVENNSSGASRTQQEVCQLDHLAKNLDEIGNVFRLGAMGEQVMALHGRMPALVQRAAAAVGAVLEKAVDSGRVRLDDLFDENYKPIPNTRPQKYTTRFDSLTDEVLPALQEPLLEQNSELAYAGAVDRNGYFPTHNRRYSKPLTGDPKVDMVNNRTKRIFDDPVGKRCGSHELPFLLQTYRRDTGEIMHDISAPIYVKGRHWGGFRIGYRTE